MKGVFYQNIFSEKTLATRYLFFTVFGHFNLKKHIPHLLFPILSLLFVKANAQQITGYWKGKIDRKNVEIKIVKNGDSLTGSSYYYETVNSFRRYSIKGYFDPETNSAVWWDDQLIEERKGKTILPAAAAVPYLSTADFNCPGGNRMFLNGASVLKDKNNQPKGSVDLQKTATHSFRDEWDYVIDNFTAGTNDPYFIDSIGKLALIKPVEIKPAVVVTEKTVSKTSTPEPKKTVFIPAMKKQSEPPVKKETVAAIPAIKAMISIEEKFRSREKVIFQEIPVMADSIELRFYDNAEVDGDSISLFLNDKLIFEHIRLTEKAYIIKLAVEDLKETNDLIMVAENLGSIPPNTSYMLAIVDGTRYEARLESTEQSSAGIRFIRKSKPKTTIDKE